MANFSAKRSGRGRKISSSRGTSGRSSKVKRFSSGSKGSGGGKTRVSNRSKPLKNFSQARTATAARRSTAAPPSLKPLETSVSRQKLLDISRYDKIAYQRSRKRKQEELASGAKPKTLPQLRQEALPSELPKRKSGPQRLQKILSAAGICSRRKAEELILMGQVQVNGKIANQLGTTADPAVDVIAVDGKVLDLESINKLYLILNKPRGYLSTTDDPQGRPTVMDLVKSIPERIYPIGRLDYASEGLILFTNDGEFANRIMHPSNQVRRTYAVKLKGEIHDSVLERIREGVQLSDGFVKPQRVERSKKLATKEWIELVLTEGKNLEIRRIFALFQIEVDRLRRVSIGPVDIESVPVGKSRELSALEVKALLAGKNHLEK